MTLEGLGRGRCRRTPPLDRWPSRAGADVLRGQRDAEAAPARLRARGLPQPRRLQRLPAALGRAGLLLAAGARSATTRRRCNEFMALDTVDVKQSRAVKKTIFASVGRHHPPRRPAARRRDGSTSPIRRALPAAVRRRRPRTRAFCVVQGMAPHRARRIAPATCRRWRRATCCRWRSCRGRRTATRCCSSTPTAGGADLKLADATLGATARSPRVGNVRSALGACAGLAGRTSTCAAPSGATTAPS